MLDAPQTYSVLKLPVHLLDNYCQWVMERLAQKLPTHIVTINAEMAILGEKDQEVGNIIRSAELVIPDGAGIVIYLRLKGKKQKRCPGIELAQNLIEQIGYLEEPYPICFYGGAVGVAEAAAQFWQAKIPQLQIISNHGFLSPEEVTVWERSIETTQPRLILVGLGVPRQEFWIREHRHLVPEATWVGVGGSFDIWSGKKIRAPKWFCDNNLEWLYRLYQEPWRWRRMLALPKFFWRSLIVGS
jgi:N-acetylglucosaminyldiphosphoundecaprenol N-acetyl-beta-D-mannosaminyltransferase